MAKNEETKAVAKEEKSELKRSWFQELKAEFHKIVWPDKNKLIRESVAVIIIAVIIGCIVALVDTGLNTGIDKLVELVAKIG